MSRNISPPAAKVNTFISYAPKHFVDGISKIFILTELLFGVYRISAIGNIRRFFLFFTHGYFIIVNCTVIAMMFRLFLHRGFKFSIFSDISKYILCNILSFFLRHRLQNFYKELNKFDKGIGYDAKVSKSSIQNIVQMFIVFIFSLCLIFSIQPTNNKAFHVDTYFIIFIKIFHAIELHYFAHLITLVSPRISAVVHYMKVSFPPNKNYTDHNAYCDEDFSRFRKRARQFSRIEMDVLMDLYHNIIKAYDYLNSAVKWQMLVLLVVSFSVTLSFLYEISTKIINGDFNLGHLLVDIGLVSLEMIPIFATCLFGDQVSKEVRHLREMLSCSLYENTLDKQNRTAAQAFMALTEARGLTFTLFHMFSIDIALPFKIMGLLLTYLIILLQFDKVINPSSKQNLTKDAVDS